MEKNYPQVWDTDWYFKLETENFFFDVHKAWGRRGAEVFRARSCIKINGRHYCISYRIFAELDYRNRQAAIEAAKEWIMEQVRELQAELAQGLEVSHG